MTAIVGTSIALNLLKWQMDMDGLTWIDTNGTATSFKVAHNRFKHFPVNGYWRPGRSYPQCKLALTSLQAKYGVLQGGRFGIWVEVGEHRYEHRLDPGEQWESNDGNRLLAEILEMIADDL